MKSLHTVTAILPLAWAWDLGRQQALADGQMPVPTPAPAPVYVQQMLARQAATSSNTCGWIGGLSAFPVSCQAGKLCAYNQAYDNAACCPSSDPSCPIATRCYHSSAAALLTVTSDPLAFACTLSASPYCKEYVYPDGFTALGCGANSETDLVFYTVSGFSISTSGEVFSSIYTPDAEFSAVVSNAGGLGSGGFAQPLATTTATPSSGGGGGSNGSGGGSSSGGSGNSGLSTGAIVGIAVAAAVVAVSAIVVIGLICWKRSKRPSIVTHQQQPQPPPNADRPNTYTSGPSAAPAAGTEHSGSQLGGSNASQPMTQANMNAMLAGHHSPEGEWGFVQKPVVQTQSAAANNDGINVTEIMPEEAVDEQRIQQVYSPPPQGMHFPKHSGSPGPYAQHPGSPGQIPLPASPGSSQNPHSPGLAQHPGSPGMVQHPGTPGPMQHPGSPPPGAYYPQGYYPGTVVTGNVAPTAFSPTVVSHHFQNV